MIVVIEGGDQSGKMTQSEMLTRALVNAGKKVKQFDFPDYTTPIGCMIKRFLQNNQQQPQQQQQQQQQQYTTPQVIHCLLAANRWEKLHDIKKAQKNNDILVMNRYYYSNIVYGVTNGVEKTWLENLDTGLPEADCIILLDVTPDESFRRKNQDRDRFEKDKDFVTNVLSIYRDTAHKNDWHVLNALQHKDDIHKEILQIVTERFETT